VTTTPQIIVVTDANVLINLMHVARLDLCSRLPGYEFVVPDHVREEITDANQRMALDDAVLRSVVRIEAITNLSAAPVAPLQILRGARALPLDARKNAVGHGEVLPEALGLSYLHRLCYSASQNGINRAIFQSSYRSLFSARPAWHGQDVADAEVFSGRPPGRPA
jgi:hypothetical protein